MKIIEIRQSLLALKNLSIVFFFMFSVIVVEAKTIQYEKVGLDRAQIELPPQELLDIGILLFDPNIPEEEDDFIFPEIRKAEARYMPFHLKKTLQDTGFWGGVWVLPEISEAICVELLTVPAGIVVDPETFAAVKFRRKVAFGPNAPEISACVYEAGSPVKADPSPLNAEAVTAALTVKLPVICTVFVVDMIEPVAANMPDPPPPEIPVNCDPSPLNAEAEIAPETSIPVLAVVPTYW